MYIGAVVLAAGESRRFGSDKRLHPIQGVPMLARTLATYGEAFAEVAAVIRPGEPVVEALVHAAGCRVVRAADAASGQSRSLAAGVAAMAACEGLIIGLGDMPCVAATTLRALASELARAPPDCIVRPQYRGRPGNPIGFRDALYAELRAIDGDRGARDLVAGHEPTRLVEVDDPGIHWDLDRPP